jgi:hypothetical protein
MLDRIWNGIIYIGMPCVSAYHLLCGSLFLNTAAEDAEGLEKWGNTLLTPVHYLLAGKKAVREGDHYVFHQMFDYHPHFKLRTAASVVACPASLALGSAVKGLSYFSEETRQRHAALEVSQYYVASNVEKYQQMGLAVNDFRQGIALDPPRFQRRPGDENALSVEKQALREISTLLHAHQIPFWLENGTCIGAFRYGGVIPWDNDVDLAILEPDFDNVMNVLRKLDPKKYAVQDWSSRSCPKAYIRIYLKENHACIDFSVVRINQEKKTLAGIFSFEESPFMPKWWLEREKKYYINAYAYDVIFPLKKANFDGVEVPVPHQTVAYLQARYGENLDPVMLYNEATGKYEKDLSHPYWLMSDMH